MPKPPLRADAERNRRQLIEAARLVFAERGLEATFDEIARRAGVGNATLYRRFPSRRDLVTAVFVDALHEVIADSDRALADPDPWSGFVGHLTFLCASQAGDRGLANLLTIELPDTAEIETLRGEAFVNLNRLIDNAKAGGDLRADFSHLDVVLVLMATAGLIERTAHGAPQAWRRHLTYLVDGLRAPGHTPLTSFLGEDQLRNAMNAQAQRYGCI
jgi:AcrR family transcriptional regulator